MRKKHPYVGITRIRFQSWAFALSADLPKAISTPCFVVVSNDSTLFIFCQADFSRDPSIGGHGWLDRAFRPLKTDP